MVLSVSLQVFGFFVSFAAIELDAALSPHLEASGLAVTDLATHQTLDDVLFLALAGFVAYLVAFETKFLVAFERIVRVLATENAVQSTALVRTLTSHMPKLLAIPALNRRIVFLIVASHLILQLREGIITIVIHVCIPVSCLVDLILLVLFRIATFDRIFIDTLFEVHITLERASRNDQVRVPLRVHR